MKQHCKFYKHNNLKECWETNDKGKTTYWIKYSYHRKGKKKEHVIKRIEDSNGWIRDYYKNGNLRREVGNPDENEHDTFFRYPRYFTDWELHYLWH